MKLISIINNINKNPNCYLKNFSLNLTIEYSKDAYEILKLLEFEGFLSEVFIKNYSSSTLFPHNKTVNKKYITFINSFTGFSLKQISRSGRRVFISNKEVVSLNNTVSSIRKKLNQSKISIKERESNFGYLYLIRTSKGIMTEKEAINNNLGGELLFKIKY